MARRREEEEYYEEEEYSEEEMMMEEGELEDPRQKLLLVMTSSWGLSVTAHVILVIILMGIYLTVPKKTKAPVIISKPAPVEQPFDEEVPRAMKKTPKIEAQKQVTKPVKDITPEKVTSEKPKGTSLDNPSTKNLQSTSTADAYGGGGGAAGAYGTRSGHGKWANNGGSSGSESAVQASLRWLKRHQTSQGNWISYDYDTQCKKSIRCKNKYEGPPKDDPIGRGMASYNAGVTGLATLAFLGNGHTQRAGKFKKVVRKALEWMKKVQVNDPSSQWHGTIGYIVDGKKVEHPEWVYNHAICTMALCEAYAITKDYALKDYAQRAVDFCIKAQNPGLGWRYDESSPERAVRPGKNDTSVTGWMVLALKAANHTGSSSDGGLDVSKNAFKGALKWFTNVTSSDGVAGYMQPGGPGSVLSGRGDLYEATPCMTAVSVLCRIFAYESPSQSGIKKGANIIMQTLPKWDTSSHRTVNMYYWYYGTYAMFQVGGKRWDCGKEYGTQKELQEKPCSCWNHAMQQSLVLTQRQGVRGDCADGSWDPIGEWGVAGGRVYSTAIGALTLEIYYRYERLKH